MNDMGFMDRESKKRQLRRNIVQPPQEERPSRYEEEDSEEVIRQVHRERRKKRILTTVMTVLFLAVTGFCFYKYQSEYEYTGYDVAWERPMRYTGAENSAENAPEAGENGTPENPSFLNVQDVLFLCGRVGKHACLAWPLAGAHTLRRRAKRPGTCTKRAGGREERREHPWARRRPDAG